MTNAHSYIFLFQSLIRLQQQQPLQLPRHHSPLQQLQPQRHHHQQQQQ